MTSSSPNSTMDCVDALRSDGVDAVAEALGGGAESLFPLRQFAEFDARKHPTRASQQAARDRQLKVVRANEAIDALNGIPKWNELLGWPSPHWGDSSHLKSTWNSRGACAASRAPCRLGGLALSAAGGTLPGNLSDGER